MDVTPRKANEGFHLALDPDPILLASTKLDQDGGWKEETEQDRVDAASHFLTIGGGVDVHLRYVGEAGQGRPRGLSEEGTEGARRGRLYGGKEECTNNLARRP